MKKILIITCLAFINLSWHPYTEVLLKSNHEYKKEEKKHNYCNFNN